MILEGFERLDHRGHRAVGQLQHFVRTAYRKTELERQRQRFRLGHHGSGASGDVGDKRG